MNAPTPTLARDARAHALRPYLPGEVRFALVTAEPPRKPFAYDGLAELARAIHRRRDGRPIQLRDQPLRLAGRQDPTPGVQVLILDPIGERTQALGWAFLAGGTRRHLEAALRAAEAS